MNPLPVGSAHGQGQNPFLLGNVLLNTQRNILENEHQELERNCRHTEIPVGPTPNRLSLSAQSSSSFTPNSFNNDLVNLNRQNLISDLLNKIAERKALEQASRKYMSEGLGRLLNPIRLNTSVPDRSPPTFNCPDTKTCQVISRGSNSKGSTAHAVDYDVFPCRAKDQPCDHTCETAYFRVPKGLSHGTHLYCSHPKCRSEGSKFRFCAICKQPKGRANFKKRHEHADLQKSLSATTTKKPSSTQPVPVPSSMASLKKSPPKSSGEKQGNKKSEVVDCQNSKKRKSNKITASGQFKCGKDVLPECDNITNNFRKKWITLLDNRPRTEDAEKMSQWMSDVISLSNTYVLKRDVISKKDVDVQI
mmetsp:Transcript_34381/g.79493  ORF Transcript_34381/g.79493 Transcript_34381/m.79493 type:complete len:362 (-) Transcript_34381:85-1170(-)|eukprot:CAMPEP_0113310254 /NCGR_PEP_ID=MMETSP0010_2-20120614/7973_1 /TAXON_ID=216773 ORGANISM="Corethron hystrix, Strain 308" /NCGR_SAMPLE_ID=MMETSP0010_2 /ASSEMBLY_ACC=CAM_ASM_000155 /LENGTH=361 /DNA_ID=CAMNT_0000165673 /DNA_START=211 /DNA_END=1296 /DNA_ORIENTATION=+ /assembly_acc=CAM_ASM_000155